MAVETLILALLASAAVALLARYALVPAPGLEIGERGIRDRRLGRGWIRWSEIEGAYPPRTDAADTLLVKIRVTDRTESLLRRRNLLPSEGPSPASVEVPLDLGDTDLTALELLEEILHRDASDTGLPGSGFPDPG